MFTKSVLYWYFIICKVFVLILHLCISHCIKSTTNNPVPISPTKMGQIYYFSDVIEMKLGIHHLHEVWMTIVQNKILFPAIQALPSYLPWTFCQSSIEAMLSHVKWQSSRTGFAQVLKSPWIWFFPWKVLKFNISWKNTQKGPWIWYCVLEF